MKNKIVIAAIIFIIQFSLTADLKKTTKSKLQALEKVEKYIEINSIKNVKEVFGKYLKEFLVSTKPGNLKDGEYSGDSIYDNYKYKHSVKITIKNGKIIKVFYNEVKKVGKGKRYDKKYCLEMKKGSGASPAEVYPIYEKELLKKQDFMKVDAISGATYSLYRFRTALIRAFFKAGK